MSYSGVEPQNAINTGLNGAKVLPLRISLFLLNGSISAEYTSD